jgi:hypothetical protein
MKTAPKFIFDLCNSLEEKLKQLLLDQKVALPPKKRNWRGKEKDALFDVQKTEDSSIQLLKRLYNVIVIIRQSVLKKPELLKMLLDVLIPDNPSNNTRSMKFSRLVSVLTKAGTDFKKLIRLGNEVREFGILYDSENDSEIAHLLPFYAALAKAGAEFLTKCFQFKADGHKNSDDEFLNSIHQKKVTNPERYEKFMAGVIILAKRRKLQQ